MVDYHYGQRFLIKQIIFLTKPTEENLLFLYILL